MQTQLQSLVQGRARTTLRTPESGPQAFPTGTFMIRFHSLAQKVTCKRPISDETEITGDF